MTGYDRQSISDTTAKILLEVQAVHFNAEKPFIFTSGWASPVYIDCRKLISYPRVRRALMEMAETTITRDIGFEQIDAVAGGETAGIPFAAWIADRMMVPMQYVRKKPKGFGRNAQIEGDMKDGARVLVIEDLTTAGGSMFTFIDAIRAAGGIVDHGMALFYYGIFPEAVERFANRKVNLQYITTWREVLAVAKEQKLFDDKTLEEVEAFLNAPLAWSGWNGGISELPTN